MVNFNKPTKVFVGCVTYAKDAHALTYFLDSLAAFDPSIDWDLCFVDTSSAGCPELVPYTQLPEECKARLPGRKVSFLETTVAPGTYYIEIIARARQQLQQEFLKHPDYTHFLMVDSDMIFPPDTLPILLSRNELVVAGAYLGALESAASEGHKCDVVPIVSLKDPNDDTKCRPLRIVDLFILPNPIRIFITGFGVLLLTRYVIEKVPFPYDFKLQKGEDILFFNELDRLGIPVIMDTRIKCAHMKYPFGDERNKVLDFRNYQIQVKTKTS